MKAILMSIKPKWCELIFGGEKTIEVRKVAPKLETPFKVYVYMTATKERCRLWEYITAYQNSKGDIVNGSQKVVGEFVCDRVDDYTYDYCDGVDIDDDSLLETCLEWDEINIYANGKKLHGLHITKPKRYDTPKELSEFYKHDNTYDNAFGWVFEDRPKKVPIKRPPQSWMYVEELC